MAVRKHNWRPGSLLGAAGVAALGLVLALALALWRGAWLDIAPPAAGETVQPGYVYDGGPVVTLELKNYTSLPRAVVLVNGEPRAVFGERYVTVPVTEGDLLEVDGSFYTHPLVVEVLDVSRGVAAPPAGRTVEVDGSVAALGRVHLTGKQSAKTAG